MVVLVQKPGLFTPITLGQRTLRNRIVFLPHATGLGVQGLPSDGHAAYFERRAQGGAGMIIQEATPVDIPSLGRPTHVRGFDKRIIGPLTKISDAVHKAGAMMLAQVSQRGLGGMPTYSGSAVWAPSPTPSPHTGEVAHAVTRNEIKGIVASFVQTAQNCIDGGYDGVEVHATHGLLLYSFLSPELNWRRDEYGGSVENRVRLHVEVLEALRKLPLGILGIRIGLPSWGPGTDPREAETVIRMIEPYVDYISVTGGNQATKHINVADFYSLPVYMLELAREVKKLTAKPVIAAGRLHEPLLAATVLEEGSADLIGLCRALISDPDWPRKVERSATGEIRHCIACNTCLDRAESGGPIGCIQNPRTGREAAILARNTPVLSASTEARRVLVVGGGPAGMQAAIRADELGMQVTLCEAAPRLGGQVALSAAVPGREPFQRIDDFLQKTLAGSKVRILTGRQLDAGAPEFALCDGIIIATGAALGPLPAKPAVEVPRYRAEDILLNPSIAKGKRAIVVINDGMTSGAGAAELLVARGVDVHIVISGADAGGALPKTNRRMLMDRMLALKLRWHFHSSLVRVGKSGNAVIKVRGEGEVSLAGSFDFVVNTVQRVANTSLIEELESRDGVKFSSAGDCVAPRNIYTAIREGFDAADRLAVLLA